MTSKRTRSRKTVAAILLIGSLLLLSVAGGIVYTLAGNNPGIAANEHGRWYLENGKVDFSKNGQVVFDGIIYTVRNGAASPLS